MMLDVQLIVHAMLMQLEVYLPPCCAGESVVKLLKQCSLHAEQRSYHK